MKQLSIDFNIVLSIFILFNFECFKAGNMPCVTAPGSPYNSCELFTKRTSSGKIVPLNADNKNETSLGAMLNAHLTHMSFMSLLIYPTHPQGSACFPTNSTLASYLDSFLSSVTDMKETPWKEKYKQKKDNVFLKYFMRIQLTIQYQIYQYLLSIYASLVSQTSYELTEYLKQEEDSALNKKTLIVHHLINVMEAQLSQAVHMRLPGLDKSIASSLGPMLLVHDHGTDLDFMIQDQELHLTEDKEMQDYLKELRSLYTEILGKYLKLFNIYTSTLHNKNSIATFIHQAEHIHSFMKNVMPQIKPTEPMEKLINIKGVNPPLFFYDDNTLRALKLIPAIAQQIPTNTQTAGWPEKIIKDAQIGRPLSAKYGKSVENYPCAYFLDSNAKQTKDPAKAASLFINIPIPNNVYTQEIAKQPQWLNSYEGIIAMLTLCLGNYNAAFQDYLYQENILEAYTSCIILSAMQTIGLLKRPELLKSAYKNAMQYFKQHLKDLVQEPLMESKEPLLSTDKGQKK